jgi:hypothetical protein
MFFIISDNNNLQHKTTDFTIKQDTELKHIQIETTTKIEYTKDCERIIKSPSVIRSSFRYDSDNLKL